MPKDDARIDHARHSAARYLVDKLATELGEQTLTEAEHERDELRSRAGKPTPVDRAIYVEGMIDQAMRRGDFDNLPGAGKPLPGLGGVHDPDWWIRHKIEREQLTGLGPPALALRVENRELDDRLDALTREDDVRAVLDDFNLRIVEARRQLLGGPPVITPVRDVDAEVTAWRQRRAERARLARERAQAELAADAQRRESRSWRRRLGLRRRSRDR